MERYDPFAEMNRMFEQMRTRMWTPEGVGRGGLWGREGLRGGVEDSRGSFDASAIGRGGINMDLKKHGDEYVFVADLPGFETDEIDLSFDGDALVVTAESHLSDELSSDETASDGTSGDERMADERTHDETVLDRTSDLTTADTDEIAVRREFTRSRRVAERVTIPEEVAEDEISATYRNGVLEVHLPVIAGEDEDDDGKKIDIAD